MIRNILLATLVLLCAAQAWAFGEIRYADRPLNVRKAPSLEAEHVRTLQPGDKVRVDFLKDGWYAVFDPDATERDEAKALGYANARFLLSVGKDAAAPTAQVPAVPVPAVAMPAAPAMTAAPAVTAPAQGAPLALTIKSEIKAATRTTTLRTARALNAPPAGTLAAGERVQAAFLQDGWYAVFKLSSKDIAESKALGYVHASELLPETPGVKPLIQAEAPAPASPTPQTEVLGQTQGAAVVPLEAQPAKATGQTPVKITADRMTYVEKDRKVTFSGNVQAEHEGLHLWAATLSAYFTEAGQGGKDVADNIERIVADGGVKMKKEKSEGSCATLTYFVKDGILRMEGNPVLGDGSNTVAGEIIKFYIKDNRSEVVGGQNKRVEAVFHVPEGVKKP